MKTTELLDVVNHNLMEKEKEIRTWWHQLFTLLSRKRIDREIFSTISQQRQEYVKW